MPMDADGDDDDAGGVPPLPPEDRLWRHPSEVSSFGAGGSPVPLAAPPAPAGRVPMWPVALVSALVGAVLCGGVLALTGSLSLDGDQVIERVKVTPFVPSARLSDDQSVDALKAKVSPSVVRLVISTSEGDSQACGVVIRDDGIVVTSAHELAQATAITVRLADGREVQGEVVGADLASDVGVVRIGARGLTVAILGTSSDLESGATALAFGTTASGAPTVSTGVISAIGQRVDAGDESLHDMIQTDAPIERSWSGGPLVDDTGSVIGITTGVGGNGTRFGFATPIDLVRRMSGEILARGNVRRGWLGIEGGDLTREQADAMDLRGGAEVRRVMPGSPADQAGLRAGDVITEIAGGTVRSSSDLVVALRDHKPGTVLAVGYWRYGRYGEVEVTLANQP